MKDIIRVSISGIAFILDDDAFQALDSYLKRLESGYKFNPDGVEIIADIEARIAEIILSKQGSDTVVRSGLVVDIIEQLGIPDELRDDNLSEEDDMMRIKSKFPRRLYRNSEGAKLGGVCSGLGTFFDIDAVWIRLAIFAPIIPLSLSAMFHVVPNTTSFFLTIFWVFVLIYIILWFAIPIARTPRQRLEMRGEKITASSIHNNFREDFSQMSGDSRKGQKSASVLAELVYVSGRILLFALKAFALLAGFALAIGSLVLLVMFFALMFGNIGGSFNIEDAFVFKGMSVTSFTALLSLVLVTPILIITYLLLRFVFNLPANRIVLSIIALLWLALTIFVGSIAVHNFDNIKHNIEIIDDRMDRDDDVIWEEHTVTTEGIVEGDSTRTDSVVVKIGATNID